MSGQGIEETLKQMRSDVLAYLRGRCCVACGVSLEGVATEHLELFEGVVFRCLPPAPVCWQFSCTGCGRVLRVAIRKGKVWPLDAGQISRRRAKY